MKVSLNTVKQFTTIDVSVDELVAKINSQLGGVEEVVDFGKKYEGATIAQIVHCQKHENADKLNVCEIDAGTGELIQVVCGAPNVRDGMFVVWLPPGSTVPSTFDDKEPFVLSARELRGLMSDGMLASARELGLGDDHDGIIEIDPDEWKPNDVEIKPGASFAEAFGLDDTIIDIENKMFTHRPDCFGQLGVAREIAGIQGNQFISPDWYLSIPEFPEATELELTVVNDAEEKVPRFMAVAMKDVEIKPSPLWLRCELARLGSKSINNIVDVTNYIMLLTSQPTHAYDYDKLRGHTLGTRFAKSGEKITLLNGKSYTLDETDIVIVDDEGPVGLGGVMGGGDSEISANTKNIVIECATFDMYTVRKTSMRHGIFTDAVTRFNKGQSSLQNERVLAALLNFDGMSGTQASPVYDIDGSQKSDSSADAHTSTVVSVTDSFINSRLGLRLSVDMIVELLSNTEFMVKPNERALQIQAPFWRTDIELPEDIVEEVGRLYGFDKLPLELPHRSLKPPAKNVQRETKDAVRRSFVSSGANELLTYSFVNEKVLTRAGQDAGQAFKLGNALSPDLEYYRLSVLPSLLDKVHQNIKAGHAEFTLFEIGKGHNKKFHADDDEGLPSELEFVDAVYASKKPHDGAAYFHLRRQLDHLAHDFGTTFVYKTIPEVMDYPITAPFNQQRSAMVETADDVFVGMIGELKQSVRKQFKLPDYAAALTLDLNGLVSIYSTQKSRYAPLSKYPSVTQDVSLKIARDVSYAEVESNARRTLREVAPTFDISVHPVSIYMPEESDSYKTVTLRIRVTSHDRTLRDTEVAQIIQSVSRHSDGQQV